MSKKEITKRKQLLNQIDNSFEFLQIFYTKLNEYENTHNVKYSEINGHINIKHKEYFNKKRNELEKYFKKNNYQYAWGYYTKEGIINLNDLVSRDVFQYFNIHEDIVKREREITNDELLLIQKELLKTQKKQIPIEDTRQQNIENFTFILALGILFQILSELFKYLTQINSRIWNSLIGISIIYLILLLVFVIIIGKSLTGGKKALQNIFSDIIKNKIFFYGFFIGVILLISTIFYPIPMPAENIKISNINDKITQNDMFKEILRLENKTEYLEKDIIVLNNESNYWEEKYKDLLLIKNNLTNNNISK